MIVTIILTMNISIPSQKPSVFLSGALYTGLCKSVIRVSAQDWIRNCVPSHLTPIKYPIKRLLLAVEN